MADINKKNPQILSEEQNEERYFLEGPRSRWKELVFAFHTFQQFIRGFRILHFAGPCVTIFGSARFNEEHPVYKDSVAMGAAMAQLGFTVMTGGGPGVMEAANRGAKSVNGHSVGCNIILPMEQYQNKYLDRSVDIKFFFVRKVLLCKYSYAFICMPGGFGTLDEFFEAVTLIQTNKMKKFPVVLFGKEYHKDLYQHLLNLAEWGTIAKEDMNLFLYTDSVEEAKAHVEQYAIERFGLKKIKGARKPSTLLGEWSWKNK
jgi:uncharacterized protein (TIGR00730 family)